MHQWTIGKRVSAISALLILLMIIAGLTGIVGMWKMKATTRGLSQTYLANMNKLSEAEYLVFELRGHVFLMALPEVSQELRQETTSRTAAIESQLTIIFDELDQNKFALAEQQRMVAEIRKEGAAYLDLLTRFRALEAAGKHSEAMAAVAKECRRRRVAVQGAYKKAIDFDHNGLVSSIESIDSTGVAFSTLTFCIFGATLIGGIMFAVSVVRGINATLRESAAKMRSSASEVTAASSQVASTSEHLAQGASEQAATLEETSASGHQISAMTLRNAEHSQTAAGLMYEVDGQIGVANKKIEQMNVSMQAIASSSDRIAKIIRVIDSIAFQTNILALNAAIEAARAGEAGMGFAVVADEVQTLARRCTQAAQDTTSLIEESVLNARNGGVCLEDVTGVIRSITESATRVKTLVDEVSNGALEQSRGMDQISRSLVNMEQTTQQSAAAAEQSASASQQLKAQATSMESIFLTLEALIG